MIMNLIKSEPPPLPLNNNNNLIKYEPPLPQKNNNNNKRWTALNI